MKYETVINNNREIINKLFSGNKELEHIRNMFRQETGLSAVDESKKVVATGHQPTIFYPGLLAKNVFAAEIAEEAETKPVNFFVDTDIAEFNVPVPLQTNNDFEKKYVGLRNPYNYVYSAFDPPETEVHNFFQQMSTALDTLSDSEITEAFIRFKSTFFQFYNETKQFLETLHRMRDDFQYNKLGIGFSNFFISEISDTRAYTNYVLYIIEHIEDFQKAYNQAIENNKNGDYQPVKFLASEDGWYEIPFWLVKYQQRYPVFVKKRKKAIEFSSASANEKISIDTDAEEDQVVEQLQEALTLYPKATTLTLMIRLFLCDVFVHGTGAVEYEKVNDDFLKLFFPMQETPAFCTATGDFYLPLTDFPSDYHHLKNDYEKKKNWLKEVKRNPEDFLDGEKAEKYKAEKIELAKNLAREKDSRKRKEIHRQLESVNEKMLTELEPQIHHLNSTLNYYTKILDKKEVLYERTYPYFLYPEGYLTRERIRQDTRKELIEGK